MFTEKDILARLANGEDPGVIANQFADMLNAAVEAQEAEKKKAARAEARTQIINDFVDALLRFMDLEVPEVSAFLRNSNIDPYQIGAETLRDTAKVWRGMIELGLFDEVQEEEDCGCGNNCCCDAHHPDPKNADAIIEAFLNKFGL